MAVTQFTTQSKTTSPCGDPATFENMPSWKGASEGSTFLTLFSDSHLSCLFLRACAFENTIARTVAAQAPWRSEMQDNRALLSAARWVGGG